MEIVHHWPHNILLRQPSISCFHHHKQYKVGIYLILLIKVQLSTFLHNHVLQQQLR